MNFDLEKLTEEINRMMKSSGLKGFEIALDHNNFVHNGFTMSMYRIEDLQINDFRDVATKVGEIIEDVKNSPLVLNITTPLQKEIETLKEENKELQKLNMKLTERLLGESDD